MEAVAKIEVLEKIIEELKHENAKIRENSKADNPLGPLSPDDVARISLTLDEHAVDMESYRRDPNGLETKIFLLDQEAAKLYRKLRKTREQLVICKNKSTMASQKLLDVIEEIRLEKEAAQNTS
jgi:hypothetical protein